MASATGAAALPPPAPFPPAKADAAIGRGVTRGGCQLTRETGYLVSS